MRETQNTLTNAMNLALSPIDDHGELVNADDNGANSLDTSMEEDARTILTATSPKTDTLLSVSHNGKKLMTA